jgi:hypothetical protein
MSLREAAQQALEALIEAARILGATQAKKGFGLYTSEDGRLEQVLHESLAKHSNILRTALAEPEQEPVAHLWQHCETGRTRVVMPDQIITADATWLVVGPLYLHPVDDTALLRQALEALEFESSGYCGGEQTEKALTALRERLGEKK